MHFLAAHPAPDARRIVSSASNSCAATKLPSGWCYSHVVLMGYNSKCSTCFVIEHSRALNTHLQTSRCCGQDTIPYVAHVRAQSGPVPHSNGGEHMQNLFFSRIVSMPSAHTQHHAGANGRAATKAEGASATTGTQRESYEYVLCPVIVDKQPSSVLVLSLRGLYVGVEAKTQRGH